MCEITGARLEERHISFPTYAGCHAADMLSQKYPLAEGLERNCNRACGRATNIEYSRMATIATELEPDSFCGIIHVVYVSS
jgi:hypothetical protein